MSLTLPLIHINGTSRDDLIRSYTAQYLSLKQAIRVFTDHPPHGRDYYPLGPSALNQAYTEYEHRIATLRGVLTDIDAILLHLNHRSPNRQTSQVSKPSLFTEKEKE